MKTKMGKPTVWSSIRGNYFSGTVTSHLVQTGQLLTLCGKRKGQMYTSGYSFDPKMDCKLCARIADRDGIKF